MLTPTQRLKLDLFAQGIAPTERAVSELSLQGRRPITLADYATTSGITLRLDGDVWVNAPTADNNPNFVGDAPPHVLDFVGGAFTVRAPAQEFQVWPVPVADYQEQLNSSEEKYSSYAVSHADRVRVSPVMGCSMVCQFCDLPYEERYRRTRIDGIVDAVKQAVGDPALPAKHVLISGGTPRKEDFDYLHTVYRVVPETFPGYAVDIMMVPLPGLLDLRKLKGLGIHGLSVNIEVFNRDVARRIMRQKFELGIQHYLDFIEAAVGVFGVGKIRSLLLVGLEPVEDTLRAVRELATRGCDPVLSPFRPDPSTPLRRMAPPSADLLERVYSESLEIVGQSGVVLGPRCIPCQHNAVSFPDGSSRFYYS